MHCLPCPICSEQLRYSLSRDFNILHFMHIVSIDHVLHSELASNCESGCPNECLQTSYNVRTSQATLGLQRKYNEIQKLSGWKLNQAETAA